MNKLLSLLGISRKAGRSVLGYENTSESIHKRKAKLILCACDLSEKTKKELAFAVEECRINAKIISLENNMAEISQALGQSTGIVCVNDSGFANAVLKLIGDDNK